MFTADFNDEVVYSQKLIFDADNAILNIKNKRLLFQMGTKLQRNGRY